MSHFVFAPFPVCLHRQGPTSLVSPLLGCMQDKSAEARQRAQDCLSGLLAAGTVQPSRVRAGTRDFQPAVMRQLKPALEKILENSGEKLTPHTKPTVCSRMFMTRKWLPTRALCQFACVSCPSWLISPSCLLMVQVQVWLMPNL